MVSSVTISAPQLGQVYTTAFASSASPSSREELDRKLNAEITASESSLMSYVDPKDGKTYYSFDGGKTFEPLTDEEREGMSESAIERYEEKAKQGLLFNDSNLSALYNRMLNVFSPGGEDEALLRQMGISVSFSATDNSSSITLDEGKLRSMLDSDPDAVADLFTRSASAGNASSDGLMQSMKTQLDRYAGTTGAVKGILVQQAGTPLSSLTLMNNTWQNQIDSIYTDI